MYSDRQKDIRKLYRKGLILNVIGLIGFIIFNLKADYIMLDFSVFEHILAIVSFIISLIGVFMFSIAKIKEEKIVSGVIGYVLGVVTFGL